MSNLPARELTSRHHMVLVRWVLIVATAYLLLFTRPAGATSVVVGLFIAAYLTSNIVLAAALPRLRSRRRLDTGVVLFDTAAVSVAILLTRNGSDFFPVYFLVVFLGALTQRASLLAGAAVAISVVHLSTLAQFVSLHDLLMKGYLVRIPFLLAVGVFFGYEVEVAARRERAAEAAARKRRRVDFLAAATHDLKNPLSVIQSLAELLLDDTAGPLSPEQSALTRRIHASVVHVIQLAVNSLDATRIRSGHLSLLRTPANLADIVERVVLRARSAADVKGIALRCSAEPPPPTAALDVLQIERVVANLIDNAVKYTPPGGSVTTTIAARRGELVLDVRDDGPGIPTSELPAIFGKYRRRAATSGIEGTGLGLFIVKAIVEAHGGSVDAQSTVGVGTTLTVRLPTTPAGTSRPLTGDLPVPMHGRRRLSWS
jgi:signal transduction histidine kinase